MFNVNKGRAGILHFQLMPRIHVKDKGLKEFLPVDFVLCFLSQINLYCQLNGRPKQKRLNRIIISKSSQKYFQETDKIGNRLDGRLIQSQFLKNTSQDLVIII